jgi:phage repressor protein C with HTH and peptisase S24 domain
MEALSTQLAEWRLLTLALPGEAELPAGVLVVDAASDAAHVRLRRDWELVAPGEAKVLENLQRDLEGKSAEFGAARLLEYLSDTLSNLLRISDARQTLVENFERALARLYREHVPAFPQPFVTHLPRYSLAAAGGAFLDNPEITCEGWEEAPEGLELSPDMFVARVEGRSMEPRIPDGSLCVFRRFGAGSRQGKLVLVEELGANDRYTVKRYRSEKRPGPEGRWVHERIRLEPLNPDYEAWDLDPEEDRFRVLAEFVTVLA